MQSLQLDMEHSAREHRVEPLRYSASFLPGHCPAQRCERLGRLPSVRDMQLGHYKEVLVSDDDVRDTRYLGPAPIMAAR